MVINSLYRDYFQKSKILLYPLLEIKKGTSVVPVDTYLCIPEYISSEDMKYICIYEKRDDAEYKNFEKFVLIKHSRLVDYKSLDENKEMFVFDFSDMKEDWMLFIQGKYSKMTDKTKRKIKDYFDKNGGNYVYIESFLYPEKYYNIYAELLNVSPDMLKEVGELCAPPDMTKECLDINIKDLTSKQIIN